MAYCLVFTIYVNSYEYDNGLKVTYFVKNNWKEWFSNFYSLIHEDQMKI